MKYITLTFFLSLLLCSPIFSQEEPVKKGHFYILWGYNRECYSRSDIHFKNDGDPNLKNQFGVYDFTLYNVRAHDKPDFDVIYDLINFSIPQFNARIGYFFNNSRDWGIELNYDHTKYVVTDGQTLHMKGNVLGQFVDTDTSFSRADFHFEHTDGANFLMLEVIKRWKLLESKNQFHNLGLLVKPGAGIVLPRTDVTIFGERLNNNWKVAGVIAGLETGLRAELYKHWVLEFSGKVTFANYINCLVHGKGNGKAQHSFWTLQGILTIGYQFQWGHWGKKLR